MTSMQRYYFGFSYGAYWYYGRCASDCAEV